MNRREFVKNSIAAGFLANIPSRALLAKSSKSGILGSNDAVHVAVIGMHNNGNQHIQMFNEIPGVRVAALCDVDQEVLGLEKKNFDERNEKVQCYRNVRKVLDNKAIDAIVVATPNHWHGLMTIWACQAAKDVYVEKPLSHNISEGEKMVQAARKYNRIVQTGTQRRSCEGIQQAVKYIQEGKLGKIKLIHCLCLGRRESLDHVDGPQSTPPGVDYNLWCGPSPLTSLMRKNLHYDWHWYWPTGGGDSANNGIHFVDLCRWFLNGKTLPRRTISFGGRFAWDDNADTPNTQTCICDYPIAPIVFELRNLPRKKRDPASDHYRGVRMGMVIECENGYFSGGMGGGRAYDHEKQVIEKFIGDDGRWHQANFIKAVRSRKVSDLNADVLEGHLSTTLCNLANISYRVGMISEQEHIRKVHQEDDLFMRMYDRFAGHITANEIEKKTALGP